MDLHLSSLSTPTCQRGGTQHRSRMGTGECCVFLNRSTIRSRPEPCPYVQHFRAFQSLCSHRVPPAVVFAPFQLYPGSPTSYDTRRHDRRGRAAALTDGVSACGCAGRRGLGGGFLLARFEASEISGAAAAFFDFVALLAHEVLFFGFFANRAMAFLASWAIGSPWANVTTLKSNSKTFWSDFKICFLSSM